LLEASTTGDVTLDVIKNQATSILSSALTIDEGGRTSQTSASPVTISDNVVADDDEFSVDITAEGDAAKGLIITFIGVA
jgi:hypothetical protein